MIRVFLLRPPSSPSQRCKVYTQKGVMPATPPLSSHTLAQDSQATDALTSDSMSPSTFRHVYASSTQTSTDMFSLCRLIFFFNFCATIPKLIRNWYPYPHQICIMHIIISIQYLEEFNVLALFCVDSYC